MQTEILRLALGVTSPTPPTSPLIEGAAADAFYTFLEVRGDEHYFVGHFPDYPIMPGVLLVEAMAQTARLMAADRFGADVEAYLVGVGKTRFFKPVLPPARLRLMARLQSRPESADNLIMATCTAFMGETCAAKAEVILSFHRRS